MGTKGGVSPESDAAAGGDRLDTLGSSDKKVNFAAAARYNPNAKGKTARGVNGTPNPNGSQNRNDDTGDHRDVIVALPSIVILDRSDSSGANGGDSATAPAPASETTKIAMGATAAMSGIMTA